jgi:hypothetical protein
MGENSKGLGADYFRLKSLVATSAGGATKSVMFTQGALKLPLELENIGVKHFDYIRRIAKV